MIKVGSLFDGIGGWLLAAEHAGAIPIWSSEIDPFPAKVSHAHFPDATFGADSKRYKALGNGMAQPCADYVMAQVVKAIKRGEEKWKKSN